MYDSTFVYTPGAPAPQFFFPNETMPNKKEGDSLSFLASKGAPESPLQESWSVIQVELNCNKPCKKDSFKVYNDFTTYFWGMYLNTFVSRTQMFILPEIVLIKKLSSASCKIHHWYFDFIQFRRISSMFFNTVKVASLPPSHNECFSKQDISFFRLYVVR